MKYPDKIVVIKMSTFSSIFGSSGDNANVDKSIDLLFKASKGPVSRQYSDRARTVINIPVDAATEESGADQSESTEETEEDKERDIKAEAKRAKKTRQKKDLNEDLESKYYNKLLKETDEEAPKVEKEEKTESGSGSDSDSDDEEDQSGETKSKRAKTVDLKENELEKAERTVFVGNVNASVVGSKPMYKKFKKLFSQYGKIQSIRFRSISFDDAVPRKVAFAKKKLHSSRDTLNAYVVFAEKEPSLKCVPKLNATEFEHAHLRVDHVAHPAPKDNKRTIFVGNLDFEEKEETLWRYFNSKTDNDVESVRVIRDAKTNVGKGFALVQFKDTLSVNKSLLLNDKPMSAEKKRKLRISKAKAHTKPSILSPNHIDNSKKAYASNKSKMSAKLSDQQRTKLGRAQTVLNKSDRATAGKSRNIIEGQRASKGDLIAGIKGLKSNRDRKIKKPRIRDRSTKFKNERDSMASELKNGPKK